MWKQISLNQALQGFLAGQPVKVVDVEVGSIENLQEALQSFFEGAVFLAEVEKKPEPPQDVPMDKLVEFIVDGPPDEKSSAEEPEKAEPEPESESESDPPPKAVRAKKQLEEAEKNFQKRKIGDIGKLRSLRAAGWPLKKLAEEFGCSEATVYNTMKREGIE